MEPARAAQAAFAAGVSPLATDPRGVPRLLAGKSVAPAPAPTASASAHALVERIAPAWGVDPSAMPELATVGEVPTAGATIVRLEQSIDGMPIYGGELRMMVRPDGGLVAASGTLIGTGAPRRAATYRDDDAGAIATAVGLHYGDRFDRNVLVEAPASARADRAGPARMLTGRGGNVDVQLARARKQWYPRAGALISAWVVEAYTSDGGATGDAFRSVLAADDGRLLAHDNLVADAAFSYRVFAETTGDLLPFDGPVVDPTPHPSGTPDGKYPAFVTPQLVTVESLNNPPGGAVDPWLPAGATETVGNNVDAYADLTAPDGLSAGDFRATRTAAGVFDRTYNTGAEPLSSENQQMAGITSLFYVINWLHDFWYDAGFTEAAGNAQADNYGRGGFAGDAIRAEAQDNAPGGSRNNANMATPGDGMPPRMQVFLWNGADDRALTLQPSGRKPVVRSATFGDQEFDITAAVVLGADGAGPDVNDACTPLTNTVTGRIVLVNRGNCTFESKAQRIEVAGGIGMLLADNVIASGPPAMGDDNTIVAPIQIGSLSMTKAEGDLLRGELAGGVSAISHRDVGVELDGGLDATLIAHEYGHYLHHRLSLCNNVMCRAMSEGWGDFVALMLLARAGDDLDRVYPFAVYSTPSFSLDPAYFGIRRVPYSTNPTVNALSFRHMADDAALPDTHPITPFGNNAEIHNAGEVWAAALWEAYVALQKAGSSFDEVRAKMARYVVAGLLMAPPEASPTETRDAILAAIAASSQADHDLVLAAFARRGFGSCAVSPPDGRIDFAGITEGNDVRGVAFASAPAVADTVVQCDDDGVLDSGETARLSVPITNRGHAALTNVAVTVTSMTPGITVIAPAQLTVASLAPAETTNVEVDVQLDEITGALAGELVLAIEGPDACPNAVDAIIPLRLNINDRLEASATDTFDAGASVWTADDVGPAAWVHERESTLDGAWHGPDHTAVSDTSVISPPLTAAGSDRLVVTFKHKHGFEFDETGAFDGGMIEVSTDGGANWRDVATLVASPYNGALMPMGDNPLAGRAAFIGRNTGFPNPSTVTLDFGSKLAGQTFQLRFRIGTDGGVGAFGWVVDEIAFSGIVGTPFPTQVPDEVCGGKIDGGCCDAGPLRGSGALAALGVLALLLRRRRR